MRVSRRRRSHRLEAAALSLLLLGLGLIPREVGAQATVSRSQSSAGSGERRIALDGAPNFRDLGGYPTADGRHVRWKRIYRSGELSRLTDADYERLAQLHIAVVCDFRRDSERKTAPTTWRGATPPTILNLPGAQAERTASPGGGQAGPGTTQSGLSPLLVESYPTYPRTLGASFRTVLQQIMTQQGAVLYHCTAGKDRTGTFSALLLTMLGVPRDAVMADYLLTNEFVAISAARIDAIVARGGSRESAIATLGVDRAYLELMFKAIDTEFGSFDAYRRTVLGVSDADLAALKATLLE